MVELLVVIAIIAVLASMVLAGTTILRNQQKKAAARSQMQGLSLALANYLSDYGVLGEQAVAAPTDFTDAPAEFLIARPLRSKRDPYLLTKANEITDAAGAMVHPREAKRIINPWGKPVQIIVTNAQSGPTTGFDHTHAIEIRSGRGDTSTSKDLVYSFDLDKDVWQWR